MLQAAADVLQRRPARILDFRRAGALFLIQILATLRAQALASFAAGYFQWQRQQHLLAQHIFQQDSFALIIADLSLGISHGQLVATCINTQGPVKQFKLSRYILRHRLEAPGTLQLQPCLEAATKAYVSDDLVLAVMLLDQFGAAAGFQRRLLPNIASQVNDTGLKRLLEIQRLAFQVFDVEEHSETPAATLPMWPAEARQ